MAQTSGSLQDSLNTQGPSPYRYHKSGSISFDWLNWTATRNNPTDLGVTFNISGQMNFGSRPSSYYSYTMDISVYVNGTRIGGWSVGGTQGVESIPLDTISGTVNIDISSANISVYGHCSDPLNDCSFNDYGPDHIRSDSFSVSVPEYKPETPATNASNGHIFSTNNSSGGSSERNISDKPDKEVWWTWTGATPGTPANIHGIKQYNIDINTRYDVAGASSISETQNYVKDRHVSLFTLCRSYGVRVGGTLYCWVNTQENSGNWLRKGLSWFNNNEKRWVY